MLIAVFIVRDDEFSRPLYADPQPDELEPDAWEAACEAINDAIEGDGKAIGHKPVGEAIVAWRYLARPGLSFVAITEDVDPAQVGDYLAELSTRYMDEADDPRYPEKEGVEDVVVDVIPPWED